jgi:DNA-binding response OmpR family regulator
MGSSIYRALVVDDEPIVRRLICRALSEEGFLCDAAADGNEAGELLGRTPYDVVITDLMMPHCNGHTLATQILSQSSRPVVIVVTAMRERRLNRDLLVRGVDGIEYKPFCPELLAQKARALAERRVKSLASLA